MAYTTIDDPSAYFQTALYNGSASSVTVTNDGNSDLQPDWLWIKRRSGTGSDHNVFDTSRGLTERLFPNLTSQSDTTNPNGISSLTDGFTTGTSYGNVNGSGQTFVTWQWKINGGTTTSFSESGSQIGGTRQVNTTAGISLITYTGNGSSGSTIPHGLSQTPEYVMVKNRDDTDEWVANGSVLGDYARLHPNATSSLATGEGSHDYIKYPDTNSTNLVTGVSHNRSNADGDSYVAWCFHSVQGYSKIGKYTGNGNADGPMVFCGFKPAWVMIKRTDSSNSWTIRDSKRSTFNVMQKSLFADLSNAESDSSSYNFDFLSNGFKQRNSNGIDNASGGTYIYMAFGETFVSSEGVPCTAR